MEPVLALYTTLSGMRALTRRPQAHQRDERYRAFLPIFVLDVRQCLVHENEFASSSDRVQNVEERVSEVMSVERVVGTASHPP